MINAKITIRLPKQRQSHIKTTVDADLGNVAKNPSPSDLKIHTGSNIRVDSTAKITSAQRQSANVNTFIMFSDTHSRFAKILFQTLEQMQFTFTEIRILQHFDSYRNAK